MQRLKEKNKEICAEKELSRFSSEELSSLKRAEAQFFDKSSGSNKISEAQDSAVDSDSWIMKGELEYLAENQIMQTIME